MHLPGFGLFQFSKRKGLPVAVLAAVFSVVGTQTINAVEADRDEPTYKGKSGPDLNETPAEAVKVLRKHGRFLTHSTWGGIWRPKQSQSWRPYTLGRWAKRTDKSMEWVSDEPFGDTVYHYGRWTYDKNEQWIWVPGSTRAPAWVAWRQNDRYVGWAPIPPTPKSSEGRSYERTDIYDDSKLTDAWVFVPSDRWMALNLKDYILPQADGTKIARLTKPVKDPSTPSTRQTAVAQYDDTDDTPRAGSYDSARDDKIYDDKSGNSEDDETYNDDYTASDRTTPPYDDDEPYPRASTKDAPPPVARAPRPDDLYDDYDDAYFDDYDDYDYDDSIFYNDIYPHFDIHIATTHPHYHYFYYPYVGAPRRYFGRRHHRHIRRHHARHFGRHHRRHHAHRHHRRHHGHHRPFVHKKHIHPRARHGIRAHKRRARRANRHARLHHSSPRRFGPRRAGPRLRNGARNGIGPRRGRPAVRNGDRARNRDGTRARKRGNARPRAQQRRGNARKQRAKNRGRKHARKHRNKGKAAKAVRHK